MTDIASFIVQDQRTGTNRIDWLMDGPDLADEDGLETAVLISLFTDRLADADDVVPGALTTELGGPPDRRGWWGDMPPDSSASVGPPALTGSRFWLRAGWPANAQTARRVELDAQEALSWMIEGGTAQSVEVTTRWIARDVLGLHVSIAQRGAQGSHKLFEYDFVWSPTAAMAGVPAPILPAPSGILAEGGGQMLTEDGRSLLEE